jgi:hypothetical protein
MTAPSLESTIRRALFESYLTAHLRVLSLWQPHASLCVASDPAHDGAPPKVNETRSWAPNLPTPFAVAIHATKTVTPEMRATFGDPAIRAVLKRCGFYPDDPRPLLSGKMESAFAPLPLGAIVGLARVLVARPMPDARPMHADDELLGFWRPGRYAWRLGSTVVLPSPIPFSGRQEPLYDLDVATRERINAQLIALLREVA